MWKRALTSFYLCVSDYFAHTHTSVKVPDSFLLPGKTEKNSGKTNLLKPPKQQQQVHIILLLLLPVLPLTGSFLFTCFHIVMYLYRINLPHLGRKHTVHEFSWSTEWRGPQSSPSTHLRRCANISTHTHTHTHSYTRPWAGGVCFSSSLIGQYHLLTDFLHTEYNLYAYLSPSFSRVFNTYVPRKNVLSTQNPTQTFETNLSRKNTGSRWRSCKVDAVYRSLIIKADITYMLPLVVARKPTCCRSHRFWNGRMPQHFGILNVLPLFDRLRPTRASCRHANVMASDCVPLLVTQELPLLFPLMLR